MSLPDDAHVDVAPYGGVRYLVKMNAGTFDTENDAVPPPAPLTGYVVAQAAASDFTNFFLPGMAVEVRVTIGAVNFPFVRKDETGSHIVIPREMAEDPIRTPERLLFHLLMIGHEIGHLVHRHLDGASAQSDDEYRSLELWADFYGAKVSMTLLTYGTQLHPIAKTMWPDGDLHKMLLDIGEAVSLLVSQVYKDHRRYPATLTRVGLTANGVTSFLRNYYGSSFDVRLYYSIFTRVLRSSEVRKLLLLGTDGAKFDDGSIARALDWHRKAQGAASAISPGFIPLILKYLHTTFDQTDEEVAESRRIRTEELRQAGLLSNLDDNSVETTRGSS